MFDTDVVVTEGVFSFLHPEKILTTIIIRILRAS
jgi:hypothetical protein